MKAALGAVHGLFGVLCADFCVRIFVGGFFGADFWCGFFGADFFGAEFWCGFFGADFCGADFSVRILMRMFGRIF